MGEQIKITWDRIESGVYAGLVSGVRVYTITGEGEPGERRWRAMRHTPDGALHPAGRGGALESLINSKAQAWHDLADVGGYAYVARLEARHEMIVAAVHRAGVPSPAARALTFEELRNVLAAMNEQHRRCDFRGAPPHVGKVEAYIDASPNTAIRNAVLCNGHATMMRLAGAILTHPATDETIAAIEAEIEQRLERILTLHREMRDQRDGWRKRALEAEATVTRFVAAGALFA